jgi:nucleoside-diphosphate-sugar epimerase
MKILIRDGDWWLGEALAARLKSDGHTVATVPHTTVIGHDEASDIMVKGYDALVIFGYARESGDPSSLIDHSTRQTYNLLHSASNAGVKRCIYVSSLKLFSDYEENLTVTEKWRSLPPSDNADLLACHLGEITCKEFARDRRIQVATVRLGFPIVKGDAAAARADGRTAAVAADDAIEAVRLTLLSDKLAQWQDIHVQSVVERQRFLMHAAHELLAFPAPSGAAQSQGQ